MSVNLISVKEFNEKIRMYIPFHEVSSPPRLGDVEGQTFECGCGESHIMNFDQLQQFYIRLMSDRLPIDPKELLESE